MKKTIVVFSGLIIALLVLFQLGKFSIISGSLDKEIVVTVIAIVFFLVGIFINKKSLNKPLVTSPVVDYNKIEELKISKREYEVLKAISDGLSNKEIGDRLFLSESTIKTHVSNLLVKLNAKRRTQALQKAKAYRII